MGIPDEKRSCRYLINKNDTWWNLAGQCKHCFHVLLSFSKPLYGTQSYKPSLWVTDEEAPFSADHITMQNKVITLEVIVDMEMLMKFAPASVATAFASMVLPVPGGPNSSKPLQGCRQKTQGTIQFYMKHPNQGQDTGTQKTEKIWLKTKGRMTMLGLLHFTMY